MADAEPKAASPVQVSNKATSNWTRLMSAVTVPASVVAARLARPSSWASLSAAAGSRPKWSRTLRRLPSRMSWTAPSRRALSSRRTSWSRMPY